MINILIHKNLHIPGEYVYKEIERGEEILHENDLPSHYFRDEDSGKYDVYSLAVWGKGVECRNIERKDVYLQVDTISNIFLITDEIEEKTEATPEIFFTWHAVRNKKLYYLEIIVDSVNETLLNKFIKNIEEWIFKNGILVSREPFIEPRFIKTYFEKKMLTTEISFEEIRIFEKNPKSKEIDVFWETEWPEYEGGGEIDFVTILGSASAIYLALNYFGLASPEQRELRREKKAIKKCRKLIYKKYFICGRLVDPPIGQKVSSSIYEQIYTFEEWEKESLKAFYRVNLIRKKIRGLFNTVYLIDKVNLKSS